MSGVFREVTLTWKGQEVRVTPTNLILRRIEGNGNLSLYATVQRILRGEPRVSEIAYVIAELIRSGGVEVSEDEVAGVLLGTDIGARAALFEFVALAVLPQEGPEKKAEAPRRN